MKMHHFIEFSTNGMKKIIALRSIVSVEELYMAARVNGEIVDQEYKDILDLLEEYANVSLDHDLTNGK